jgi:uncharacterized protein YqfB (UPF0267 family)
MTAKTRQSPASDQTKLVSDTLQFTRRVLGPKASDRLLKKQVTQSLRSHAPIRYTEESLIQVELKWGAVARVSHEEKEGPIGNVKITSIDPVKWENLKLEDAERGGFDSMEELEKALNRAGYRFRPINEYQFYRIRFEWEEA